MGLGDTAMKISVGLVCAFLACGLTASADTAAKTHYKQNGVLCTAQEIANSPRVKVRYGRYLLNIRVECLTESEWKQSRIVADQRDREQQRWWAQRENTPGGIGRTPAYLPPHGRHGG